jgi:hypothetical protein
MTAQAMVDTTIAMEGEKEMKTRPVAMLSTATERLSTKAARIDTSRRVW